MKGYLKNLAGRFAGLGGLMLALTGMIAVANAGTADLRHEFAQPPEAARPWVYWFWLNGNITSNGITADLEAMKRVGIGGVLIMEVDQGTPKGAADFGKPGWRKLFQHVCSEASRLGLQVNMNNDAGWCGSGGPWITPDLAMQKLTWSETNLVGPLHFEGVLAEPTATMSYYKDIAVFAFPTPKRDERISDIAAKAAFTPQHVAPADKWPAAPADATIPRFDVRLISAQLGAHGAFSWEVPAGNWTVLRLGHTLTGKDNHPAPLPGRGLESDKLSRAATDATFAGLMGNLVSDSKPLAGKTLVATHIDSWETGSQNWTPTFREDFKRLRGYDPLPLLPTVTGRIIENREVTERFLWDLRQTVCDLILTNYAGRMHELANQNGLALSIEAYDGAPCDEMTFAGRADEPMSEFWSWQVNTAYSCTEMASAAHTYGKRILGAEAFTATDGEKWLHHPASIKALGDWAFCEGINRFVFHRYALQPWDDVAPGMSMGPWGLHYERTQTWWEQSKPWHEYLARCQYLLRQGLFVADICFLQPEGSPRRFSPTLPGDGGNTPDRPGYNFDGCTPEVLLTRMQVRDGRLVLPDGMSYAVLVLPKVGTMTPALLTRIQELVQAGATVIGPPPAKSPSLSDYPNCDAQVRQIAEKLWGSMSAAAPVSERQVGKGKVIWGTAFAGPPIEPEPENVLNGAKWIWYPEGNPANSAPPAKRYFEKTLVLPANRPVTSASFAVTADNRFEAWVNGKRAGAGDNFSRVYKLNVGRMLQPGTNLICLEAENLSDHPNPAGWIGALTVTFKDGTPLKVVSDASWVAETHSRSNWFRAKQPPAGWVAAMELGGMGMQPWGTLNQQGDRLYEYPAFEAITNWLASHGLPPDFEAAGGVRYIHRRDGDTDLYFIANPADEWRTVDCAFRATGRNVEIWDPLNGKVSCPLVTSENHGRTRVTLTLEPAGSRFVMMEPARHARPAGPLTIGYNGKTILPEAAAALTGIPPLELASPEGNAAKVPELLVWENGRYDWTSADGKAYHLDVTGVPDRVNVPGPWKVTFPDKHGRDTTCTFEQLGEWGQHADPRVKYFSGTATYEKQFALPDECFAGNQKLFLDLGEVRVIAEIKLNGKDLGVLWRKPFRVDITDAARQGMNELTVKVVNLWINRMIGDEQLPEDSARNDNGTLKEWPAWLADVKGSPTGRATFTSWRLWKKDSPLQESGLLGPVRVITAQVVPWAGKTGGQLIRNDVAPKPSAGRSTTPPVLNAN